MNPFRKFLAQWLVLIFAFTLLVAEAQAACTAPPSNLLKWWPGEGTTVDVASLTYGTMYGGAGFTNGVVGQAFSFNGVDGHVRIPDSPQLRLTNNITVDAWIKPEAYQNGGILVKWDAVLGYEQRAFSFSLGGDGLVYFGVSPSGSAEVIAVYSTNTVPLGQWSYVAATYDGIAIKMYVNGTNEAQVPYNSGIYPGTDDLAIGGVVGQIAPGGVISSFPGSIDEPSIYDRALSDSEVAAIFAAGNSGKCFSSSAPVVLREPVNQSAYPGESASFSVRAMGNLPLGYQWWFGTGPLSSETNADLSLNNVATSQAGSYFAVITNSFGATTSAVVVLTVTSSPPCAVSPAGLLHWWRGEGNFADEVGALPDGNFGQTAFASGKVGNAFSFNGIDDAVTNSTPGLTNILDSYTTEFWAYPTAGRNSTGEAQVGISGTSDQRYAVWPDYGGTAAPLGTGISVGTNGVSVFEHGYAQMPALLAHDAPILGWTHIAVVYSNRRPSLYINGAFVHAGVISLNSSYPSTWLGGQTDTNMNYGNYAGLLDEVSIYGRALAVEEVQAIYAARSSGKCVGPTAPVVFQQPKNKTVEAGSDFSLSALASGTAPLSYHWLFNETNILETTSSTLTLTNVQLSQAGTYALQVSNAYGTALSSNAILTVTPPPPCVQPAADLVSWWRAEAGAWDELGGNSGVFSNNVSFGKGKVGQAFVFDGAGDAIQLGNPVNLQLQTLTMEGWVKRASTAKASQGPPGSGYLFAFGPGGYGLMMESSGGLDFGKVGGQMMVTSVRVSDTNYHHVAVTKSGTSVVIYLDGVRRTSFYYTYTFTFTNPAAIGARPDGLNGFWGNIDEFSIYKRALTAPEITSIFKAGVSGKCITPTAPVLLAGLADQVATVGDTVSFGVSVGGTPPFSYQWTYKEIAIEGQIGPSLTLANVQMAQAGLYSVVVTNSAGSTNSSSKLAVNFAPAAVRVLDTIAEAGRSITVPITIVANGNENAIGFSLNFSPSQLTYDSVSLGSGIFGGMPFVNANAAANGKVGVAVTLPPGATLNAGMQELALVTFKSAILTNTEVATVGFGDSPIGRQLSDAPGNPLPANYAAGNVTINAAELEGDISPRPGGDHNVTITDWVLVGRYVALLDSPTNAMEFQHADCAPRATLGDGALSLIDWVQAGRYAARLDDLTLVGGPASPLGSGVVALGSGTRKDGEIARQIKVADAELVPGLQGNVAVQLVSQGDENAVGFSLLFDPAVVTYVSASPGADAPAASLTVNASQGAAGHVAVLLALPPGANFAAGSKEVVRLSFKLAASATGSSTLSLTDQPVRREVSDVFATSLPANYVSGKITVGALPALAISHTAEVLTLSWPSWASNFVAQQAYALGSSSLTWTNVPVPPVQTNGQNILQLPAPNTTRFFRLQLGN